MHHLQKPRSLPKEREYDPNKFRRFRDTFPLNGPPVISINCITGDGSNETDVNVLNDFMNSRDRFFTRHNCIIISDMAAISEFNVKDATVAIMSKGVGVEINRLKNQHSKRFMAEFKGDSIENTILPKLAEPVQLGLSNLIEHFRWTYKLVNPMFIGGSGKQLKQGFHTDMSTLTLDDEIESMDAFISFIAFTNDCRLWYRNRKGIGIEVSIPIGALCIAHGNFIHAGAAYGRGANQIRLHHMWLQPHAKAPASDTFYPVDVHGE
jgi:hypothetical protein